MATIKFGMDELTAFAKSVEPGVSGGWYDVWSMAQTMLALADEIDRLNGMAQERLSDYDRITLALSILIEDAGDLTKKQIRARMQEIYRGDPR